MEPTVTTEVLSGWCVNLRVLETHQRAMMGPHSGRARDCPKSAPQFHSLEQWKQAWQALMVGIRIAKVKGSSHRLVSLHLFLMYKTGTIVSRY